VTYDWVRILMLAAAIVVLTGALAVAPIDDLSGIRNLPDATRYLDDPLAVPPVRPRRAGNDWRFG
jgi:hypothetical protein